MPSLFWFLVPCFVSWDFPGGASGKESACQCRKCKRCKFEPWMQKMPWRILDPLSRILAWKIPWTEKPSRLQSIGLQRVGHTLSVPWDYIGYWCYCFSITQSCPTLCDPMDCSMSGLPVPHHLPESAQVHTHCISDAIQPGHPLIPSSLSALNLSQYQGLFQWVVCSHQMTKLLELQLQHQFFQWIFKVDLL